MKSWCTLYFIDYKLWNVDYKNRISDEMLLHPIFNKLLAERPGVARGQKNVHPIFYIFCRHEAAPRSRKPSTSRETDSGGKFDSQWYP